MTIRRQVCAMVLGACCVLVTASCGDDEPATEPAPDSTPSASEPADSAPESTPESAPASQTTPMPSEPDDDGQDVDRGDDAGEASGEQSDCGTITVAGEQSLQVSVTGGDCDTATRVVTDFHEQIDGERSAGSPTSATVGDGWDCVAGPASAHGGTTCSRDGVDVLAAVATE